MRAVSTAIVDALAAGYIEARSAAVFDLAEGVFGFWSGLGPMTWNAIDFTGAGQLIRVSGLGASLGLDTQKVSLTLASQAGTPLTPDVLQSIESYTYHQRPAVLYTFFFSAQTFEMLGSPNVEFRGYIDQIAHSDQVGGESVLTAKLVSKARDHGGSVYRRRSVADQELSRSGDVFHEHVGRTGDVKITFGKAS